METPSNPNIYHIAHIDRLQSILKDGKFYSDAHMSARTDNTGSVIGMNNVKARRLLQPAGSLSRGMVGEYVPFYFRPRTEMLYIIHMGNHRDLTYKGGQGPILHFVTNFDDVVAWADSNGKKWAFTHQNASTAYAEFHFDKPSLDRIEWEYLSRNVWNTPPEVEEAQWSEFIVKDELPWHLIQVIGVRDEIMKGRVEALLVGQDHRPLVEVREEWYY